MKIACPAGVGYKERMNSSWYGYWRAWVAMAFLAPAVAGTLEAADPIKALLITGGCCHDYGSQKDVLKQGLEARANVIVAQVHTDDRSTKPPLAILGNPDYAQGYDLVIHDECGAGISDEAVVRSVLKPHRDGVPGVNLHCAMHSYRIGNPRQPLVLGTPHSLWFEYLGLQSSGHGPKEPIDIRYTLPEHPIVKGLPNWRTLREELYNNVKILDTATVLASGKQVVKLRGGQERTDDYVITWINEYGANKTRVFSTTLGHYTETVADPRYLDLVTRGLLWATGRLTAEGQPAAGYGPPEK